MAFWILFVVLIVAVIRRRPGTVGRRSSAVRVLEERYARGEISREEFLERRSVLVGEERPS